MPSGLNYVDAIATYCSGIVVSTIGDGDPTNYENLMVVSGEELPAQEVLDSYVFLMYKTTKIVEFSEQCRTELLGGFGSDVYESGVTRYYDSYEVDQLNLIGLVAAGQDALYACRETKDSIHKSYYMHTSGMLLQLLQDGRDWKTEKLQKFNNKKEEILVCSGYEGVDAISWDD